MKTKQLLTLAVLSFILGLPTFARAQEATEDFSSALIADAFAHVVANDSEPAQTGQGLATSIPEGPETHPTPAHTGFRALVGDMWSDFKTFPRRRSTWVILGIGAGAALLAHPVDDNVNAHLVGRKSADWIWAPGKYLGAAYTQAAVSVGLYTFGRYIAPASAGESRTNKWSHLGLDLLRAQIVSQTMVHTMKYAVRRDRPTGECCSFPSGHATTAFATAAVIERHLGYRMSVPAMVIATYVATSRLHDNRHFLSDVIFGSALGTATGWTVVGRHGRNSYALAPVAVPGGFAFQLSHVDREGNAGL
jgi:membrane-associated phospholipid phosphatase